MIRDSLLVSRLLFLPNLPSMLTPFWPPFRETAEDNYVYHDVCMCLYNRARVWRVHVQMGTPGGVKGQRGVSPATTLCLIFRRQRLSLNLSLAGATRLAGQKVPASASPGHCRTQLFTWVLGF